VRGCSPPALARQEAWALLLVHNMTAALSARAARQAGLGPGLIPFTAVLSLIRGHATADACCPHCGKRPPAETIPSPCSSTRSALSPPTGNLRQDTVPACPFRGGVDLWFQAAGTGSQGSPARARVMASRAVSPWLAVESR
jgi:hypothetical protein